MDKFKILEILNNKKQSLFAKYNIEKLALFGSFAKNMANPNSDVDILYHLKDGFKFTFDKYLEFEEELKNSLGLKVDLVNETKIDPLVKINAKDDFIYV